MALRFIFFLALALHFSCIGGQKASEQKQPESQSMPDEVLLDSVQRQTLRYFWDRAEPTSGMACERVHMDGVYPHNDKQVVTSGGSGFGVMAILAGIDRGFIEREAGLRRLLKVADFLESADRFHGVWPHWWHGDTGKTKPFSKYDDGGDIVETAFMAQALLCVRQYFKDGNTTEKQLAAKANQLWREIEWDWHQGPDKENVLFWHWSPNYGWKMGHRIQGYNECMIAYILGASSPTHPIPPEAFHEGWARGGAINHSTTKYGHTLQLKHNGSEEYGGPLFWAHYSFLGLDPRKLEDRYANYWEHNTNHTLINRQYCIENPKGYAGYGPDCWGLTASYSVKGYAGHSPGRDLGVISPTAALSSFPYTPEESMEVLRHLYGSLEDKVIGSYGPYDAFSIQENWFPQKYLAIDQGPIIVMIENYRSGLLWELFMSCPEVQNGLNKLGFSY